MTLLKNQIPQLMNIETTIDARSNEPYKVFRKNRSLKNALAT